jgi:hypothetical protein
MLKDPRFLVALSIDGDGAFDADRIVRPKQGRQRRRERRSDVREQVIPRRCRDAGVGQGV